MPLTTVDRIIAIGSDRMMAAIKLARLTTLEPYLKEDHVAIASINSPMQCMMKEVCAQCLQRHVDPKTGKETIVFTCFNQDQQMDRVDFPNLSARLRQNTVKEKLASLWFDKLMAEKPLPQRVGLRDSGLNMQARLRPGGADCAAVALLGFASGAAPQGQGLADLMAAAKTAGEVLAFENDYVRVRYAALEYPAAERAAEALRPVGALRPGRAGVWFRHHATPRCCPRGLGHRGAPARCPAASSSRS